MSKAKPNRRFDDLFQAVNRDRSNSAFLEDNRVEEKSKQSKSTDPQYKRTTIYIRKSLHRQLKAAAAAQEREMSEIIEEMVENYIKFCFRSKR